MRKPVLGHRVPCIGECSSLRCTCRPRCVWGLGESTKRPRLAAVSFGKAKLGGARHLTLVLHSCGLTKRSNNKMLRKMLLIASAVAIPLGATAVTTGFTAVAESGTAGAAALAITCKVTTGTVNFATPGISANGSVQAASTSTTTTSTVKYKCTPPATTVANGTTKPLAIVSNATPCVGLNNPIAGCATGMYTYDSTGDFAAASSTLWQTIGTLSIKIGAVTYKANLTSSAATLCTGGEVGFNIKGKLTALAAHAGESVKDTICLGADTGVGVTGSFTADIGQPGVTIATATIATDSKAKIS